MVAWSQTDLNNCLPSHCKWFGRTFPLPTKRSPKMPVYPLKMNKLATNGALGMHTALKNDLYCSAVELVYGTILRLPAKFFLSSDSNTLDQFTYVTTCNLKKTMKQLQATPTQHHVRQKPFVSSDLSHCTHTIPQSSQGHWMWRQNLHYRHQQTTGGNITGLTVFAPHSDLGSWIFVWLHS